MVAPRGQDRWYGVVRFRSIFGVLLGTVILPTAAITAVGVLIVAFWREDFDLAFGVVTLSFSVVGIVGGIIATVLVARSARRAGEQSDFVWSVSHELKTPLTSIRMFAETLLLDRAGDEAERRECLEHIAREAERLGILVERLLDVRRMEAGDRVFADEPVEVRDLVQRAVDSQVPLMKERGAAVHVHLADRLPALRGDREALVSALANLIENAIRHGGGAVTVRARCQNRQLLLDVEDHGPGIPRLALQRIFEKFYRVNPALSRKEGGLGIGLALVRQIAEAHGGAVDVHSVLGKGSTFTLRLSPAARPQAPTTASGADPDPATREAPDA
jgi:two-component system phosphate regulon sensor histidine kinase PhoR